MPPDSIMVVDKPKGPTSRKVVDRVKLITGADKAGHAGTLDPVSTGVLVVCLGRGTLLSGYLAGGTKEYLVSVLMGVETDTYDIEGTVIGRGNTDGLASSDVEASFGRFLGKIHQKPPVFSAVKHRGKRLYLYARRGIEVETEPRLVDVDSIELLALEQEGRELRARLMVACGPGTYVRSLVHDMGRVLGCGACVEELRRTRSGVFAVNDAIDMERLSGAEPEEVKGFAKSLEEATASFPTVAVNKEGASGVAYGKPLHASWIANSDGNDRAGVTFRVLDSDGSLLALYGPPREEDGEGIAGRPVRVIRPFTIER